MFLLGLVAGVIITSLANSPAETDDKKSDISGITLFEKPGECVTTKPLEVMQVIDDNYALAYELEYDSYLKKYRTTDLLVLITNDNGEYYYDEQMIKIQKGKCFRQVGVYQYINRMDMTKTVPIVKIMDK